MATPNWIEHQELADYANSPAGNPDNGNRPFQEIYAVMGPDGEHNDDGTHKNDDSMLVGEQKSYTGDGVDPQVVSLDNSNLLIYFLIIMSQTTRYPVFVSKEMSADDSKILKTDAFQQDMIQAIDTKGQFSVGGDVAVNNNLEVYDYIALGVFT